MVPRWFLLGCEGIWYLPCTTVVSYKSTAVRHRFGYDPPPPPCPVLDAPGCQWKPCMFVVYSFLLGRLLLLYENDSRADRSSCGGQSATAYVLRVDAHVPVFFYGSALFSS